MRRLLAAAVLGVAACSSEPPIPVVVYAPTELEASLERRARDGGFAVEVIAGDIARLTDAIIDKQDRPRADVLVTSSVIDIWRAADRGALRPLNGSVAQRVAGELRDPDGAWAAFGHQSMLIGVMPDAPKVALSSYADLVAPELAGSLCMTTSTLPRNRVLIAMLIEDLGLKQAERVVRAWSRNLAHSPFASETELATALQRGDCSVAIVSSFVDVADLVRFAPEPTYRDIQGIGVARHAEHPEAAQELVTWLLATVPMTEPLNASGTNIGIAGYRDEEARLLAERAGYR